MVAISFNSVLIIAAIAVALPVVLALLPLFSGGARRLPRSPRA
jgi:hypothetical protein